MPSADGSPLSRNQAKKLRLTRPSCRFRSFPTSASVRAVRFIPFFQSIFVDFDSGSPGNNIKGVKTKSQDYACCICQCQLMKNDETERGYRHKKSCFQSSSTSQYTKSISEIIKCSKVKWSVSVSLHHKDLRSISKTETLTFSSFSSSPATLKFGQGHQNIHKHD